jgi:hypothetical protein
MTKDEALSKIRKLLAMSTDGRGNMHEAEAAMRQATALMRKFQIDSAEEVLSDLKGGECMIHECDSIFAYPSKNLGSRVPVWVGMIAVGVGRLCSVKADVTRTKALGICVRFSGYAPDVQFARWMYRLLIETVHTVAVQTVEGRGEREAFRYGAASTLQNRLYQLAAENDAEARKANLQGVGTALMVIDNKRDAVEAAYGETETVERNRQVGMSTILGSMAGAKINIPSGRPVSGATGKAAIS